MWSAGKDTNENGERVRLYQPILYGRKPDTSSVISSFVGGTLVDDGSFFACENCQQPLHPLVQLYVPERKRTFQLLACNRASCFHFLFPYDGEDRRMLSYGGKGVVKCRCLVVTENLLTDEINRTQTDGKAPYPSKATEKKIETNEWSIETDMTDMAELESILEGLETKKKETSTMDSEPKSSTKTASLVPKQAAKKLPCFEIHSMLEPPASVSNTSMDEDDVGIAQDYDDRKIQDMIQKYMAEEEDEAILSALRGTGGRTSESGKKLEKDERLSLSDRALLTYTDRLKRAPRQVLRLARGGTPLWSIPLIPNQNNKKKSKLDNRNRKPHGALVGIEETIPPCENCGKCRIFEFQVLPSLLHVLQVDRHNIPESSNDLSSVWEGAMDWGNIAVFSCDCQDDILCVIQDSVDEVPTSEKMHLPQGDVLIQEGSKFDDDDDDDDDGDGEEDDDDIQDGDFDNEDESW